MLTWRLSGPRHWGRRRSEWQGCMTMRLLMKAGIKRGSSIWLRSAISRTIASTAARWAGSVSERTTLGSSFFSMPRGVKT